MMPRKGIMTPGKRVRGMRRDTVRVNTQQVLTEAKTSSTIRQLLPMCRHALLPRKSYGSASTGLGSVEK